MPLGSLLFSEGRWNGVGSEGKGTGKEETEVRERNCGWDIMYEIIITTIMRP